MTAVEYLGALVKVGIVGENGLEAAALLPDRVFVSAPVEPGQTATLTWLEDDAHALAD